MVVKQLVKKLIISISFLTALVSQSVLALTAVTASVDKNPVTINESLILTIIADDDVNTNALDTSVLLKDFIVGRTSVSTQTSIINFKTSRTTRWTTVLIARKAGKITIPALTIDNHKTQDIALTVLASNDINAIKQQNIFITTEVSSHNVYVQQLLTLTVKLHFSVDLKRGSLSEPTLDGANIVQIGKDQENEQIINGKRFRIIERLYAINPQKSGEFNIISPRFSGEIMMPSARRSNFLSFAETKPVSVVGENIALTVQPIPVAYQGQWLPSEILTLQQKWQPDLTSFKVGEPITRTITLTAAGLSKEQLPKIKVAVPKGLKIYPDQAERHSNLTKDRLVAQQVQSFAIVASRAGNYELPAISIPWFNTVTNKIEQALIPAQQITVLANTDFPEEPSPIESQDTIPTNTVINEQPATTIIYQSSWLQWLFLALWLLTSVAWVISVFLIKKSSNAANTEKDQLNKHGSINNSNSYPLLISACKTNQAENALALLLPWINSLSGVKQTIVNLDDAMITLKNNDLNTEIKSIQQYLYGKNSSKNQSVWQGSSLLAIIQSINKQGITIVHSATLSLNP